MEYRAPLVRAEKPYIEGECVVYVFNMSAAIESRLRCLCVLACFSIKALCHATRADCLLIIEATRAFDFPGIV